MSEPAARRRRDAGESNGAPSTTRTCDLLVRSQTLYPAELWARQKNDPSTMGPGGSKQPPLKLRRSRRSALPEGEDASHTGPLLTHLIPMSAAERRRSASCA